MTFEKADLIFTTSSSLFSEIVKWHTQGIWSHVMLATGEGDDVITADAEGVVLRAMRPEEKKNFACLFYPPRLFREDGKKIIDWACSQVGKGYDFLGLASFAIDTDVNDEDRWFCSEIVFMAYLQAEIELQRRIEHAFVTPRDLWISPLLKRRF